jgi:hypothetical protein
LGFITGSVSDRGIFGFSDKGILVFRIGARDVCFPAGADLASGLLNLGLNLKIGSKINFVLFIILKRKEDIRISVTRANDKIIKVRKII